MAIEPMYKDFCAYLRSITAAGNLSDFKQHPIFRGILEHVSEEQGHQYLRAIQENTPLSNELMCVYLRRNDAIGGGLKYSYKVGETTLQTSPSNFRYLYHACLILLHIKGLSLPQSSVKLVEVGCGYGGLCLALFHLAPLYEVTLLSYHLIDLPDTSALQELYLSEHEPIVSCPLTFHSASSFGGEILDDNLFLVSNYCFSEISSENQKQYRTILFPKVSHGFMVWNHIPVYPIGFPVRCEPEVPLTGPSNHYLYF